MIYVILGPTASGKTYAANKLAEFLDAPIINADAFQIYRDMDIGTNKIAKDDKSYSRYHLIDIVSPDKSYSVKEYQTDFRKLDLSKYKDVVICGGTGLYIRAALFDYEFPETSSNEEYLDKSNEELYSLLKNLDYEASLKIHSNNRKRVVRALNLINDTNKKKSEIINEQSHSLIYKDVKFLFINPDRASLYEKINERVEDMFALGLVDEVKSLINKYELSQTAKQAIGYKEVISYLNNELSLVECKEEVKKRTRNYAKRQVTFFKHQFSTIEYSSFEELLKEELKHE